MFHWFYFYCIHDLNIKFKQFDSHRNLGFICRWRSSIKKRYSYVEISDRAWYCNELGWYGKDMAPYILQWIASRTWRTSCTSYWSSIEPESKSREDDTNHVWNFQYSSYVCRYSSCIITLRIGTYNWHCPWHWWWCYPYCSNLWRLFLFTFIFWSRILNFWDQLLFTLINLIDYLRICITSCDFASWSGWPWSHRLPHEDPYRTRLFVHDDCRTWDCSWYQGEIVLCGTWFWARDGNSCIIIVVGEKLWITWWAGNYDWKWTI